MKMEGGNFSKMLQLYRRGGISPAMLSIFQPERAEQVAWVRSLMRDVRDNKKEETSLRQIKAVALDLETTGFRPYTGDEIISVGAVRMNGKEFVDEKGFYSLVNPGRPIPENIRELTGINDDMVRDAPNIQNVLTQLMEYMENRWLIAHFSQHDQSFLKHALWKHFKTHWTYRCIDTSFIAKILFPQQPTYELEELQAPHP